MKKIREVLRLRLDRKASVREIASACNIGRTTALEYLHRAAVAGISWPLPDEMTDAFLQRELFPPRLGKDEPPRPLPDWSEVQRLLGRKGMTLLLLWQEYRSTHPDGYGYSRYAGLYREWLAKTDVRMLQHHKAGEKMFVDWAGLGIDVTDPKTGEVKAHPVFVSALGLSQHIFAKAYENGQLPNWLLAHVDALEFYGAVPEIAVPDNPKTGVEKACRYEPVLNPSYAELAAHYGIAVLPARVRKPRDKAKVENAVLQIERWVLAPLAGRTFFSLDEANHAMSEKLAELNNKIMKGPNLSRRQFFEMEDRPAMRPLPASRYRYAEWKRCKVAPDYHIEVHSNLYSVPFGLVGKQVDVRIGVGTVEVFLGGKRVASHLRALTRRNPTTEPTHMPEGHRARAEWTPERMVRWAETVGPNTAKFVEALLKGKAHPEHGFRMCFGIIRLAKEFEHNRVEAACAKAHALGALSYTSVKSILEKNLDSVPEQPSLLPLPSHDNIRGGDYYKGGSPCAN